MNVKFLNSLIDVISQKGILVIIEAVGIYYLFFSYHDSVFNLEKSLIGLSLVISGAIFELLNHIIKIILARKIFLENEQLLKDIIGIIDDRTKIIIKSMFPENKSDSNSKIEC
jgi:hypothetical protein